MCHLPRELSQNAHSDVREKHVPAAARYFDYGAAVALRNLAAAYGTAMPRYLLAPVLLSHEPDQKKRLLIETFWNTGGRLNEVLPLTDPAFVQRLREYLATVQPKKGERIWDVSSPDTVRSWIRQAVTAAGRNGVTFTVRPVTTKTFRDSFAMHLVQHGVPKKSSRR